MNRKIGILVIVIVTVVISSIYILRNDKGNNKTVNYAYVPNALVDAPSTISEKEFKANNISAKPFSSGIETVQALIGDATNIATLAEWPFLLASLKRDDLRIVAIISVAKSMGMVANKEKGINTVTDLVGKSVGFPQGTSAQYVYETFLNSNGLKDKVKAVNLTPPNLQPSIVRGDIDAMVIWQPFLEKVIQANPDKFHFIPGSDDILNVVYMVVTTDSYIKSNPDGIKNVLQILVNAADKINSRNTEDLQILSNKTNIDMGTLNKLLPLFDYEVKIDSTIINTLEKLSIWAESSGFANKEVLNQDWRHFIYSEILKEIAPQNVKL
jgi:NitT/TauT family transport system substrate-binding protein